MTAGTPEYDNNTTYWRIVNFIIPTTFHHQWVSLDRDFPLKRKSNHCFSTHRLNSEPRDAFSWHESHIDCSGQRDKLHWFRKSCNYAPKQGSSIKTGHQLINQLDGITQGRAESFENVEIAIIGIRTIITLFQLENHKKGLLHHPGLRLLQNRIVKVIYDTIRQKTEQTLSDSETEALGVI